MHNRIYYVGRFMKGLVSPGMQPRFFREDHPVFPADRLAHLPRPPLGKVGLQGGPAEGNQLLEYERFHLVRFQLIGILPHKLEQALESAAAFGYTGFDVIGSHGKLLLREYIGT